MTKPIFPILFLLFFAAFSNAQEDYMGKIVTKACSCLEEISEDVIGQGLEMQLGVCILNAAGPYQKELLSEYGLDLSKMDTEGEQIGMLIGGKMAVECPNILVAVTQRTSDDESLSEIETISTQGVVTDISTDFLIYFSIKNEDGRTEKYYWYSFVDSNTDLIKDYSSLQGKSVSIEYHKEEFFDPKIMEYRPLNIIDALNID